MVEYAYDAWGNNMGITGTMAGTLGVDNPFRYKGYYYDTETGLYYLNSRYYNPELGRFINADSILGQRGGLLTHNLFAYCCNNPVMLEDPNGNFIFGLITLVVGYVIFAGAEAISQVITEGEVNDWGAVGIEGVFGMGYAIFGMSNSRPVPKAIAFGTISGGRSIFHSI